MRKTFEYNGHQIEVIAIERLASSTTVIYKYLIKEILPKKFLFPRAKTLIRGTTLMWEDNADFETEIMKLIDEFYKDVNTKEIFENNVKKFFKSIDK